ncbi:uncharacterized protein si:ch211-217g15.3 [Mugil cephalus]|uniref:uncharacterized protein si:ch211-217g15.3 n=1 Tax=Mugil cephalus TaxID=48193 RepID=UPI001FB6987D|nr:uncharacterized protein si:ch211-217g15.3 [Mugil cephalus]
MFRITLIVCVSLICGITAKPLSKIRDEALQRAVLSLHDKGKMSWGIQVEPPEDMDEAHFDIDPRMRIWRRVVESTLKQQPRKPEEDLDELFHPSVEKLLQNLPEANVAEEMSQGEAEMKKSDAPVEDKDDIDHPAVSEVAQEDPKQVWDEDKARQFLSPFMSPLLARGRANMGLRGPFALMEQMRHRMRGEGEVRVHLEPEVDMDDVYHKEPHMPVVYQEQSEVKAADSVDLPSQQKYSEPEEDMDHLYHQ